jgi:hypothetical protein
MIFIAATVSDTQHRYSDNSIYSLSSLIKESSKKVARKSYGEVKFYLEKSIQIFPLDWIRKNGLLFNDDATVHDLCRFQSKAELKSIFILLFNKINDSHSIVQNMSLYCFWFIASSMTYRHLLYISNIISNKLKNFQLSTVNGMKYEKRRWNVSCKVSCLLLVLDCLSSDDAVDRKRKEKLVWTMHTVNDVKVWS